MRSRWAATGSSPACFPIRAGSRRSRATKSSGCGSTRQCRWPRVSPGSATFWSRPEGHNDYFDRIIARGDVSPQGLRKKARFVLGEMQRRLSALGFGWHDTTATQVYTVHDLYPFLAEEIVRRGAARAGLTWHFARPPVVELEYEMDCRGVGREQVII